MPKPPYEKCYFDEDGNLRSAFGHPMGRKATEEVRKHMQQAQILRWERVRRNRGKRIRRRKR